MPELANVNKLSLADLTTGPAGSVKIASRQQAAPNGLLVTLLVSAGFVGAFKFQQDNSSTGTVSLTDAIWGLPGTTYQVATGSQVVQSSTATPVAATITVQIPTAIGDLYVTGVSTAGDVSAYTWPAPVAMPDVNSVSVRIQTGLGGTGFGDVYVTGVTSNGSVIPSTARALPSR